MNSEERDITAFQKLNRQLINLQQSIENAVLKRSKTRMDAELDRALANPVEGSELSDESEGSEDSNETKP